MTSALAGDKIDFMAQVGDGSATLPALSPIGTNFARRISSFPKSSTRFTMSTARYLVCPASTAAWRIRLYLGGSLATALLGSLLIRK